MSEKEKLREQSLRTIRSHVDETTLFVDLDDPITKADAERKYGLELVRVCIVQNGQKLHAFLNLEAAVRDGCFALTLEANKPRRAKVQIGIDMPRDGHPLEVSRGKK